MYMYIPYTIKNVVTVHVRITYISFFGVFRTV